MYGDGNFKYTPPSLHRSSSSNGLSFILGAGPIESAVEDAKEKVKNEENNKNTSNDFVINFTFYNHNQEQKNNYYIDTVYGFIVSLFKF
jgi:hypothetical protein